MSNLFPDDTEAEEYAGFIRETFSPLEIEHYCAYYTHRMLHATGPDNVGAFYWRAFTTAKRHEIQS